MYFGRRISGGRARVAASLAALVLAVVTVAAPAVAEGGDAIVIDTGSDELGTYLVGPEGMTLYYFTRDVTPGVSVCNGACAEAWPPLLLEESQTLAAGEGVTGPLGVIERADGSRMAAYRGRPLYYWASDEKPGDTTGQGVGGVWFVARADGSMPPNPPAQTLAVATGDLGSHLVDARGMTVYLFTRDETPGQSVCTGDCLTAWPPVSVAAGNTVAAAEGVTGVLGLIPTGDGRLQVTYDGRPLYYFQGDTEPGQTTGQAINDVWFVVAP